MFLPTNHVVGLCKFTPQAADALNVQAAAWAEPVNYPVCGWYTPTTLNNLEPFQGGHDRAQIDLCLITPDSFPAGFQDRVAIPTGEVLPAVLPFALGQYQMFDVQGFAEDHTNGPWWNPGVVVWNLRRIVGA